MISQSVQDALNKQLNMEFSSFYSYLAMSAYCEHKKFRGCAKWLKIQSDEELAHALKLFDFLLARDCRVVLSAIPAAKGEFESVVDVFRQSLKNEQAVSKSIDELYELAHHERAFAEMVELQWFITKKNALPAR